MIKQVFISYSTKDILIAYKFKSLLERKGYTAWIDRDGIEAGEEWARKIPKAINDSVAICVLLTGNSKESTWVPKEILKSIELKKKIIPLKFPYIEIPFELQDVAPIEFPEDSRSREWTNACNKLIRSLSGVSAITSGVDETPPPLMGWEYIDNFFFDSLKGDIDQEDFIDYFDGSEPNWKDAITDKIPVCHKAQTLVNWFEDSRISVDNKPTRKGVILVGPGGEGKSTTIMQVLSRLITHDRLNWKVLWRIDNTRPFPAEHLRRLPQMDGVVWVIAADNAERIAKNIHGLINENNRDDIQYFLAARDTDLIKNEAGRLNWSEVGVTKQEIGAIDISDAEKVIGAWPDRKELPSISELSIEAAARKFLAIAVSDPAGQSSLYGALLSLRTGEGYKERIERIFNTFKDRKIAGSSFTLLDAYICIAIVQADNIRPQLPKEVLSEYLGISMRDLQIKVIEPLAKEIHVHSNFVYCRHRSVADVVWKILSAANDLHRSQFYKDLLAAAFVAYKEDASRLDTWKTLWKDFGRTENTLAVELAKLTCLKFPDDEHLYVKVSRFLRDSKLPEESINLLAQNWKTLKKDRAVWSEWGCCEATNPLLNHAKGAWLQGVSLSDYVDERLKNDRIAISLVQLTINFWELWRDSKEEVFLYGCYATNTMLRLLLEKDENSIDSNGHDIFRRKKLQIEAERKRIGEVFPETHINSIQMAIIEAWRLVDKDQRAIGKAAIPVADNLRFEKLSSIFFKSKVGGDLFPKRGK